MTVNTRVSPCTSPTPPSCAWRTSPTRATASCKSTGSGGWALVRRPKASTACCCKARCSIGLFLMSISSWSSPVGSGASARLAVSIFLNTLRMPCKLGIGRIPDVQTGCQASKKGNLGFLLIIGYDCGPADTAGSRRVYVALPLVTIAANTRGQDHGPSRTWNEWKNFSQSCAEDSLV